LAEELSDRALAIAEAMEDEERVLEDSSDLLDLPDSLDSLNNRLRLDSDTAELSAEDSSDDKEPEPEPLRLMLLSADRELSEREDSDEDDPEEDSDLRPEDEKEDSPNSSDVTPELEPDSLRLEDSLPDSDFELDSERELDSDLDEEDSSDRDDLELLNRLLITLLSSDTAADSDLEASDDSALRLELELLLCSLSSLEIRLDSSEDASDESSEDLRLADSEDSDEDSLSRLLIMLDSSLDDDSCAALAALSLSKELSAEESSLSLISLELDLDLELELEPLLLSLAADRSMEEMADDSSAAADSSLERERLLTRDLMADEISDWAEDSEDRELSSDESKLLMAADSSDLAPLLDSLNSDLIALTRAEDLLLSLLSLCRLDSMAALSSDTALCSRDDRGPELSLNSDLMALLNRDADSDRLLLLSLDSRDLLLSDARLDSSLLRELELEPDSTEDREAMADCADCDSDDS